MTTLLAFWKVLKGFAGALAGLADMLPAWLWATLFAGAMATGCVHTHQRDAARVKLADLTAQVLQQETTRAEIARLAEAGRRAAERNHAAELAAINERTANEQKRIDAAVRAALDSVRDRPDRPAGGGAVPGGATTTVACTGAQLYRPDAQFLVREAGRADGLRNQLADCRARYDAGVTLTGGWETYRQTLSNTLTTTTPKGTAP